MSQTLAAASYHYTGTHLVKKEPISPESMDRDAYFDSDSDSEIASQILASFRNVIFQKDRCVNKDLSDTYLNLDYGDSQLHESLVLVPDQSSDAYSQAHIGIKDSSAKVFRDLSYSTLSSTQEIPVHPFVSTTEIPSNQTGACGSCDPYQSLDSNFQYGNDSSGMVSSTENLEAGGNMDASSTTFFNTQKKFDKSYQKTNHELPPCRVCGYKASGFHYGANTCEACKGFFRRSLKKDNLEYKCIVGDYSCVIQKGRRNNCPLCRYNKCLNVGMSKDAIKTGRYTHEKRTQDIIEVKGLKGDPLSAGSNLKPAGVKIKEEQVLEEEQLALIDRIFQAHKMLFPLWHKAIESGMLPSMFKSYAEKYQLKRKEIEILEIYPEETSPVMSEGEDRMKTMDILTKHLELAIMVFVKFAKSIPGFCDLPLNDQATLVKSSRFEVWMIGAHKFISRENNVVIGPRGNAFHVEELSELIDGDFVNEMFDFSAVLQEINLSNEEIAMMKSVVLTFSDRLHLEEPEKVEQVQLGLVACLQAQLNSVKRFSQVMNAFVRLRDLTEWNKRVSENLVLEWPTIKHNPLLMEVMNL